MIAKIAFWVIGYFLIGTLVTGWAMWYADTAFDIDDAVDVVVLIAIWPITVIAVILAVLAGLAMKISGKNKKS